MDKEKMEEIRNAVAHGDLRKVVQNAKDMGIKITKEKSGYHGIYNKDGMLEKLDIYRHFKINGTIDIPLIMDLTSNETQAEVKSDKEVDE